MARRPSRETNLTAIAKRLNLAVSTVSRAMRAGEGVHSGTRARVLEAARSMGYDFSRRHVSEPTVQPHCIMALAQCSSPHSDQRYLAGMSRAAVVLNLAVLSHHTTMEECSIVSNPKFQPTAMRAGLIEGVVLIHHWPGEAAAQIAQRWPTVSIVHHYPDTAIDHVSIDDRVGIATLVDHLRAAGHTRIGFFGLCREMSWSCSRFSAYVEALMRLRLSYEQRDVFEISLQDASIQIPLSCQQQIEAIIARTRSGVSAWVCPSSGTGYALCRGFLDAGLSIPEDVAVVGYHRSRITPPDLPLLTSVQVADEELGAAALRRLFHRIKQPGESHRSVLLPPVFLQGETTRKVAA